MHWNRYWDIILYRAYAELKAEGQLSYMGYVWWVLEPLLNTVVFYVILATVIEQVPVGGVSVILVGAVIWQWTNNSISSCAGSIIDAGGMLKHIYLPKPVLPLIVLLTTAWKFLFIFVLLLLWVWATGYPVSAAYAALPLLIALQMFLNVALSLPMAVVMPYFPDARITVDAGLRSLMLVSGIFAPIAKLPPAYRYWYDLNPMAIMIQAYRDVLLTGHWPSWNLLSRVLCFSVCALGATLLFYGRIDRSIVKSIHR